MAVSVCPGGPGQTYPLQLTLGGYMTGETALQADLKRKIEALIASAVTSVGDRIVTSALARELRVSRTPVNVVLERLAAEGKLERHPSGGFAVLGPAKDGAGSSAPELGSDADETDAMMIFIARARMRGHLGDEISTRELSRVTGKPFGVAQRALTKLEELGSIERKPGYGWIFPTLDDELVVLQESNRYRQIIEPQALLSPDFQLDRDWIEMMRRQHSHILQQEWSHHSSIRFYEMNAAFHEGLAAASGNRFILDSIRRQNQIRRLSNYDWLYGTERVQLNTTEHMLILDHICEGKMKNAARLMAKHLRGALKIVQKMRGEQKLKDDQA